ncbi:Linearmycin resistance ATP-binding protein LnrL [Bacillus rhizoplanae]|uniref:Linearmycin resistance ATP-binding protein LnrL n=1 Tax=Bacillus rhizoplanae TaxID=2880966 RepID=A0ABN8A0V5_9BACI|nr:ATP-binding cassette domain-containing protein [Bacillus rhizoplanae]CAG9614132.1 Linearmycin resistance ATP-binding protein LnrL [Bacillus rhizoplanae]
MIEVKNVTKSYKILERKPGLIGAIKALIKRKYYDKQAVKPISFSVEKGEMVGYIGFNGAGKSTTIKMLCGILTPDTGEIRVNGIIPYKNRQENAKNIGAVFGQRTQLAWDIPVRESFELLKHVYEISETKYQEMMHLFEDVLDLGTLMPLPVRQLSLGQKMRCELAAAFLHQPSVVFLDEPTIGLDIDVKAKIRSFIKEMNKKLDATVVLTTHDMQDIEELCQRIIIIDKGSIIYDGDLQDLKDRFSYNRILSLELEEHTMFEIPVSLQNYIVIQKSEAENTSHVELSFHTKYVSSEFVLSELARHNKISDLTISNPKLETIIKDLYQHGGEESLEEILGNA